MEWKRYRRIPPIEVEAIQFDSSIEYDFIKKIRDKYYLQTSDSEYVAIANTDFIIKKDGKLFVLNKNQFEISYSEVLFFGL